MMHEGNIILSGTNRHSHRGLLDVTRLVDGCNVLVTCE